MKDKYPEALIDTLATLEEFVEDMAEKKSLGQVFSNADIINCISVVAYALRIVIIDTLNRQKETKNG